MENIFLFSALIGGTFLVCQFVTTLFGMGESGDHIDLGDHFDAGGHADGGNSLDSDAHHSSWLFGIISFRTLVSAITFFGLSGMFMLRSGAELRDQLLVASISGLAALFGVHWLMRSFQQLSQSGTLRLSNAIGKIGTVNVPIPGSHAGQGKVQLEIQGRLEEIAAVTALEMSLKTGSRVHVVALQQGNVLEVEPAVVGASVIPPT